ncbi:uncharacterized protein EI90DRAFT_3122222 [Cantharellus anzutake]|uniref:uncharacterized protein n=1 Tax=Cantharellus anzutake TaxID=1750568 RepID=UPI001904EE6A|nr:uncharacterized protein EI90DRAFT_3122222 [Cantharellus anzutake]KAF8333159.1 hypothetical protein EI90DRAFT_3122222 [Cantharellus anzutake]
MTRSEKVHSSEYEVLNYVLYQHYPETSCVPGTWNLSYFLDHTNVVQLARIQAPGVSLARAAGKPVILLEFNSVSCGGKRGQSDTASFGVAMWTIDYVLSLAVNNWTAAYIHTREAGISYNLINPPNPRNSAWSVGPQYYSLLFLAEALQGVPGDHSGSVIVADLNLPTTTTVSLAGYAIYDKGAKFFSGLSLSTMGTYELQIAPRGLRLHLLCLLAFLVLLTTEPLARNILQRDV